MSGIGHRNLASREICSQSWNYKYIQHKALTYAKHALSLQE